MLQVGSNPALARELLGADVTEENFIERMTAIKEKKKRALARGYGSCPEQMATGKDVSNPLYGCDGLPKTVRVFQFTLDSRSEKLDWLLLHQDWKLLLRDVAASFDSAVHRVHAVSFDAAVASTVSAACCVAAGYIMFASADSIKSFLLIVQVAFLLIMFLLVIIMPPRRFKKKSVRKIVEKRVAKAIEKLKTRADSNNTGGSGSTNTGGTVVPEMHGYDNVKFAMCTFEGRALTWWNRNVQTLGLANANQIPWSNVKAMMTTEYCPATEIQRMEQELWTLTLKGDDIEAYNNRFHELALMCHELVPTKKKKIERYIRGFPERIKGNITSSKPATLHEAINMARELVEQAVQGRAARIGESNKRKWEDNQRNNNNNNHNYNNNHNSNNNRNRNNNHHQQQNRRQENVRAYAAAPAGGKIYAGNLP
ncbi:putative reverse transcriptase domain-containing protein, partial [Tanacetum coccineum]